MQAATFCFSRAADIGGVSPLKAVRTAGQLWKRANAMMETKAVEIAREIAQGPRR